MRNALYLDLSYDSLKVLCGDQSEEIALQRAQDGRLTPESRSQLSDRLAPFRGKEALCALPGRGVSIRHFDLPQSPQDNLRQILSLKLEEEFPLPPEELAWGYHLSTPGSSNGHARVPSQKNGHSAPPGQRATVLALRREAVGELDAVLTESGVRADYCLGLLQTAKLAPKPVGAYAVVDIGRSSTDVLLLHEDRPLNLRTISWGGVESTRALARELNLPEVEAEVLKKRGGAEVAAASHGAITELANTLRQQWRSSPHPPQSIFLCGGGSLLQDLCESLQTLLQIPCRLISSTDSSSALTSLASQPKTATTVLLTRDTLAVAQEVSKEVAWRRWLLLLLLLVLSTLLLRYLPPIIQGPQLRARLQKAQEDLAALPSVDRELQFLDYIESRQLAALDALRVISEGAPSGTKLSEISVSESGVVTFSGQTSKSSHLNQLRQAMTDSGWFDGTPVISSLERAKKIWKFRIVSDLKPFAARPLAPKVEEPNPDKSTEQVPPSPKKGEDSKSQKELPVTESKPTAEKGKVVPAKAPTTDTNTPTAQLTPQPTSPGNTSPTPPPTGLSPGVGEVPPQVPSESFPVTPGGSLDLPGSGGPRG